MAYLFRLSYLESLIPTHAHVYYWMFCRGTICSVVNCLSDSVQFPYVWYMALYPILIPAVPVHLPLMTRATGLMQAAYLFSWLSFGVVIKNPTNPMAISTCRMGSKRNTSCVQDYRGWHVREGVRERFGRDLEGGQPFISSQDLSEFCPCTEELPCFCEAPTMPDERIR